MSTVEIFDRSRRSSDLGIKHTDKVSLDWASVIARKNSIIDEWSKGKKQSLPDADVEIIRGGASFISPEEIEVNGQRIGAKKFVITTGSKPVLPKSIKGHENAFTSDQLLEQVSIPKHIIVIGGGYIGLEMAFCFSRAGSRVTVLTRGPHILRSADHEIRDALVEIGKSIGMEFRMNVKVKEIHTDSSVEAEADGESLRFSGDVVLLAAGRVPNTDGLNLSAAGVSTGKKGGILVNEFLQSLSVPHIYAAGDVTGQYEFTPIAYHEALAAAHNAVNGNSRKADYSVLPSAVFTIPSVGQVGLTEQEARKKGIQVKTYKNLVKNNPASSLIHEDEGMTKIVCEEDSRKILGVHMLGPHAADLIVAGAIALKGGLTIDQLTEIHAVFPTVGSMILDAAAGW